jgi:Ran GTPase-activating protein (RanGAP) involved in mRNA processing and transport
MILVLFGVIYTQQLEILDLKDRLIRRWTESLGIPYAKDMTNEAD